MSAVTVSAPLGEWAARANCLGMDPSVFFPECDGVGYAKSFCQGCEVKAECLAHAMEHDERHGIWGGTSARERRMLRMATKRRAA